MPDLRSELSKITRTIGEPLPAPHTSVLDEQPDEVSEAARSYGAGLADVFIRSFPHGLVDENLVLPIAEALHGTLRRQVAALAAEGLREDASEAWGALAREEMFASIANHLALVSLDLAGDGGTAQ